jgi:hypothetical protein
MAQSTTPNTTTSSTFVLRFWREWTGAESRWRGRIEHVQSGQRTDFLALEGLLHFLRRFGIYSEHLSTLLPESEGRSEP